MMTFSAASAIRPMACPHSCSRLAEADWHSLRTLDSGAVDMPTHSRRPTPEQIAEELDGLIETRDVERATGYPRRWISVLIARGCFPPPDVQGRLGSAHRWRRSTIRGYLNSISQHPSFQPDELTNHCPPDPTCKCSRVKIARKRL